MADVYSDVATVQKGGTLSKMLPNAFGGKVRSVRAVYVAGGTVLAGSKIHLATLPENARVLAISSITVEGGQYGNLTLKVGTAADDDKFLASVTVGGASTTTKTLAADILGGTIAGGEIIATTGGTTLVNDKKIIADLYFVTD